MAKVKTADHLLLAQEIKNKGFNSGDNTPSACLALKLILKYLSFRT